MAKVYSVRQKRFAKKAARKHQPQGERRTGDKPEQSKFRQLASLPTKEQVEPKILAERIEKLVDIGVDPRAISYLSKAGFQGVREVVSAGKARIREVWGMKSRYDHLESSLHTQGVTIGA